MNPTKMDMAKVIVTALYDLPELVTEKQAISWKHAIRKSRGKKESLTHQYELAKRILEKRND